jgi:hypothetical protein
MTADRDLSLAIIRRLVVNGHFDAADVDAIATEVEAAGGDDHRQVAHEARVAVIEAAMQIEPVEQPEVTHRRNQMRLRTAYIAEGQHPSE